MANLLADTFCLLMLVACCYAIACCIRPTPEDQ